MVTSYGTLILFTPQHPFFPPPWLIPTYLILLMLSWLALYVISTSHFSLLVHRHIGHVSFWLWCPTALQNSFITSNRFSFVCLFRNFNWQVINVHISEVQCDNSVHLWNVFSRFFYGRSFSTHKVISWAETDAFECGSFNFFFLPNCCGYNFKFYVNRVTCCWSVFSFSPLRKVFAEFFICGFCCVRYFLFLLC
jgi:hypothetical protein